MPEIWSSDVGVLKKITLLLSPEILPDLSSIFCFYCNPSWAGISALYFPCGFITDSYSPLQCFYCVNIQLKSTNLLFPLLPTPALQKKALDPVLMKDSGSEPLLAPQLSPDMTWVFPAFSVLKNLFYFPQLLQPDECNIIEAQITAVSVHYGSRGFIWWWPLSTC